MTYRRRTPRLTTRQRGYGAAHERLRAALAPQVATGAVRCARCGERIGIGAPWDLGHTDHPHAKRLGLYLGPEHRHCSRAKKPIRQQTRPAALAFFDVTGAARR